jgi:hypothetical protein
MGVWMVWCEKNKKNDLEASRSMTSWRAPARLQSSFRIMVTWAILANSTL